MQANQRPKILYFALLLSLSAFVLACFLRPAPYHAGINQYDRARFVDMVDGTASQPFVHRMLVPSIIRIVTQATPESLQQTCADQVEAHARLKALFTFLNWETLAAYPYWVASILMLLCFMGFGHYIVKLTEHVLNLPAAGSPRLLLLTGAMLGLPALFKYVSYLYDPAQLFLFTLALYLLATQRIQKFCVIFLVCCLNKETAILLIPVYALTSHTRSSSPRPYWRTLAAITAIYLCVKLFLSWLFRANPGFIFELHPLHNLDRLTAGWSFPALGVFLGTVWLIRFRWQEKPAFLRVALPCILLPLVALALFMGFIEEWRGYYEAYPIVFALLVDSLRRLNSSGCGSLPESAA